VKAFSLKFVRKKLSDKDFQADLFDLVIIVPEKIKSNIYFKKINNLFTFLIKTLKTMTLFLPEPMFFALQS
jgi:hypothetical protein